MQDYKNIILVIEDEKYTRVVLEYNLILEGFDVYLAEDGYTGLKLAKDLKPDLILLDWMMPEMDGLEVLSELKHCEQTRDVPVLMLTARASEKDIRSAQDLGIDGYIVKPFDPVLLSKDIREKFRVKTKLMSK